ncbi:MAG: protein kinase [Chloroflexi bacterium]|nr:protein kinase [Chloroflexota bacterium]
MTGLIGQQLSQYHIESVLGEGSLGVVYKAREQETSRRVAVKIVHESLAAQPLFQRRFLQSGETAVRLQHPAILAVYDVKQQHGTLFMAMALMDGGNLAQKINHWTQQQQRLALPDALNLVAQLADAVGYAHERHILHRAIKPDNIFIHRAPQGTGYLASAMLSDFGMNQLLPHNHEDKTDALLASLPYQSPEQALVQPVDGRSDLYALGVVLYQLVTGQLPHGISTPKEAILKHLHEFPKSPFVHNPGLPETLSQIIVKALDKKPSQRFQTGHELAMILREAATHLTSDHLQAYAEQNQVVSLQERKARGNMPRLLINHQYETTRIVPLDHPVFVIGRSRQCDIQLSAEGVSRQHVRLEHRGGCWTATDLQSTNGTFLSDTRIPPQKTHNWLASQKLRIGPYTLRWQ